MSDFESDEFYRVTEILGTYAKLDQIPPDVLDYACERGTAVHKICTAILQEIGVPEIPEKYQGYVDSFLLWKEQYCKDAIFLFPYRFFDLELMVTGECDCVMKDASGKRYVIDFKTSSTVSKTWGLQGAAYKYLCNQANIEIDSIAFVLLKKDGSIAKPIFYQYQECMSLFLDALRLHKYFNPLKKKKEKNGN